MRVLFKVLAVFFGLGTIGQLIIGNIFPIGFILTILFAYLGWKEVKKPEFDEVE